MSEGYTLEMKLRWKPVIKPVGSAPRAKVDACYKVSISPFVVLRWTWVIKPMRTPRVARWTQVISQHDPIVEMI